MCRYVWKCARLGACVRVDVCESVCVVIIRQRQTFLSYQSQKNYSTKILMLSDLRVLLATGNGAQLDPVLGHWAKTMQFSATSATSLDRSHVEIKHAQRHCCKRFSLQQGYTGKTYICHQASSEQGACRYATIYDHTLKIPLISAKKYATDR